MRIDVHNLQREYLFRVEMDRGRLPSAVKPPADGPPGPVAPREVFLEWDGVFDDRGHLRRCPVCGCRELFVRKNFPQVTGLVIVVLAATLGMILFLFDLVLWGLALLFLLATVDALIYFFTGRCLVCYRCRSEFRDVPISPTQQGWELAVGEKYRDPAEPPAPSQP